MDDEKESQIEIKALKEEFETLRIKLLNKRDFREWDHQDIAQWIVSLQNGRFMKYEKTLRKVLSEEEVTGQDLVNVDRADIKLWGISKFADSKELKKCIDDLVNGRQDENENIAIQDKEGGISGGYYK